MRRRCQASRQPVMAQQGVQVEDEVRACSSTRLLQVAIQWQVVTLHILAGRSRNLRGPGRSRQERHSKDNAKLLLLYDDNILDNDPQRESKNTAFAQSYLSRVSRGGEELSGDAAAPADPITVCSARCARLCRTRPSASRTLCPCCTSLSRWGRGRK